VKWFPSNGSDAQILDHHCADCAREPDCPLLAKSMLGEVNEMDEWTANDLHGRGFICAAKQVR